MSLVEVDGGAVRAVRSGGPNVAACDRLVAVPGRGEISLWDLATDATRTIEGAGPVAMTRGCERLALVVTGVGGAPALAVVELEHGDRRLSSFPIPGVAPDAYLAFFTLAWSPAGDAVALVARQWPTRPVFEDLDPHDVPIWLVDAAIGQPRWEARVRVEGSERVRVVWPEGDTLYLANDAGAVPVDAATGAVGAPQPPEARDRAEAAAHGGRFVRRVERTFEVVEPIDDGAHVVHRVPHGARPSSVPSLRPRADGRARGRGGARAGLRRRGRGGRAPRRLRAARALRPVRRPLRDRHVPPPARSRAGVGRRHAGGLRADPAAVPRHLARRAVEPRPAARELRGRRALARRRRAGG
jgi:hypothetical protein